MVVVLGKKQNQTRPVFAPKPDNLIMVFEARNWGLYDQLLCFER